jgi:tRNA (cytidine/uridine-2'-O-)-methyltransferase
LLPENVGYAGFFKTKADCNIIDVYGHFACASVKKIDEPDGGKDAQNLAKPMFNVVLVEPEIPPNTGNIARLCAATDSHLHIVGVTGFRMDDRTLKRAGLDYWEHVVLHRHIDLESLYSAYPDSRFLYLTTKSRRPYTDWAFADGDFLVFGPETRGLPAELLARNVENSLTIPMTNSKVRSLNLSTSVGIVLFEAIRQVT